MALDFFKALSQCPIIAAIHSKEDAEIAAQSAITAAFLLGGRVAELRRDVTLLQHAGKFVFVHLDLVEGLRKDGEGVLLLRELLHPDGVLTTKSSLIRTIHEAGMLAGQRCFILDGQSYHMAVKSTKSGQPDFVELMPGLMPDILRRFQKDTPFPVVAGGLVSTAIDAQQAFTAGATGISTSTRALWTL